MKEYVAVQVGGIIISVLLVLTFYILLLLGVLSSKDVLVHLILIVLTVVGLSVFSEVAKIEYLLRRKK